MRRGADSLLHRGRGQHHWLRCGRRGDTSGTVAAASSLFSMPQCRSLGENWWKCRTLFLSSSSRTLAFQFMVVGGFVFLMEVFKVHAQDSACDSCACCVSFACDSGGVYCTRVSSVFSPAPVVEYLAPAPAVVFSPAPVMVCIAPVPALFQASAPVMEYSSPASLVFPSPAPIAEYFSPAPAVSHASAFVVGYFSLAPAVFPSPVPVVDDFSSAPAVLAESTVPDVEQDTVEEEEEEEEYDQPVVYYSGFCEFLDMEDFRWQPQREGTFRLLRNSEGAKFFQFWQNEQLLVEDYLHLWTRASTWSERTALAVAQP